MWAIPTGTSSTLKKKSGKESQYMVPHPELGSDSPIGSDRETGCDNLKGRKLWLYISSDSPIPEQVDKETDSAYAIRIKDWERANHQIIT